MCRQWGMDVKGEVRSRGRDVHMCVSVWEGVCVEKRLLYMERRG